MYRQNTSVWHTDRRTDRQTDILPGHSSRYAYASHGKNRNRTDKRTVSNKIQPKRTVNAKDATVTKQQYPHAMDNKLSEQNTNHNHTIPYCRDIHLQQTIKMTQCACPVEMG